jgi:hypothetical protein
MSPWRWTQIKGSKHVGQWNWTINVIELYILLDCEYKVKMYGMNNIKFIVKHSCRASLRCIM